MKKVIINIALIISLCACTSNKQDLYLSFTSAVELKDSMYDIDLNTYCYSINSDKLNRVSNLKYYSQYPLSTYSNDNKCVYYSQYTNKKGYSNAAIYKYDIKTKKSNKYIDYVDAINDIRAINDNKILIVGQLNKVEDHNMVPTIYNIETKKVDYLDWDVDQFVSHCNYNPINEEIVLSHYSIKEDYDNLYYYNDHVEEMADKGIVLELENPNTNISVIKDNKVIEKISLGKIEVNSVFCNDSSIYYLTNDYYKTEDNTDEYLVLMKYDRKTKKTEKLTQISRDMDLSDIIYIDDTNIYAITYTNNTYKLVNYNISQRHSTTIYESGGSQAINNCQIYKYN